MISEIFSHYAWLWPLAWQSTACLAAGLGASFVLRRWPVRAHQLLLLALIAAVVTPALSQVVRQHEWGLLAAKPAVTELETAPVVAGPELGMPRPAGMKDTMTRSVSAAQEDDIAPAPAAVEFELARLVFVLWIVASSILLIRLTVRFVLGYGLVRRSEPVTVSHIVDVIEAAKAKLGIEADVVISSSGRAGSPLIWCWGRPLVLLAPTDACRDGDRLDWMSVVCHELAHWKRRDHVTGLFAELMVCILPWQPLLWWTRHRLVSLSEEACDDWVIASGQATTSYARTLLGLTPQGETALAPAVVTSKKGLAGRVRRILQEQCSSPRSGLRWSLAAVVLAGCLAVGIAFAQTRPSPQTGTVKRITHHGAIVETLASAVILRGRALDPNNQPADDARIVALPM
ncbi:MAG: M56 family metallopeptidase, partial [Sedimentisphaerales bacterium]|nr:M56 family metallopeptidase [Sedimentisphaerales bacterium]